MILHHPLPQNTTSLLRAASKTVRHCFIEVLTNAVAAFTEKRSDYSLMMERIRNALLCDFARIQGLKSNDLYIRNTVAFYVHW